MKTKDKVFVVTGGGSGIGRELVLNLLEQGASVAAVDINQLGLQETAELAGADQERLSSHVLDVTDRTEVEELPEIIKARHGTVDGLVNNAGIIQPFVKLNDLEYQAINRVLNINLYGVIYMTKAFLPHLLERPEAHIVNVSSMGGFLPVPGQTLYGASKAAVKLLTEGLYSELLDTNVQVTVVFPGAVATNITENSGVTAEVDPDEAASDFPSLPADEAAEIIIKGIEANKYRVLVGSDARTMDFLYRLAPKRAAKIIFNQMRDLLG
jgi:short-subunit dehydrogenase